jgi:hypothetical protein
VWVVACAAVVLVIALVAGIASLFGGDGPKHRSRPLTGPTTVVPAYFLGTSATGTRLYAEPHSVRGDGDAKVLAALRELTSNHGPDDPDYTTVWPKRSFTSVTVGKDSIVVGLGDRAAGRPKGLSPAQAVLGLQQLVWTADAAAGSDLPVELDGASTALGVAVTGVVRRDESFGLLAPVDLSSVAEGAELTGTMTAGGSVSGEVGRVEWRLKGPKHKVVRSGTATAEDGTWSTGDVDLAGVAPGSYVLVAKASATGQTSAARGNYSDDRSVQVK